MAQIAVAMATSHAPQISTPSESWHLHVERDRKAKGLYFRGRKYDYQDLVEARKRENLEAEITPEKMTERYDACQRAVRTLERALAAAAVDIAVIVGDDQDEIFSESNMPAFSIYWGETLDNAPIPPEFAAKRARGLVVSDWGTYPPEKLTHSGEPTLGKHLIESLIADEFDVAHSRTLPAGRFGNHGIPHAYGFVYRRLMNDKVVPNVPVLINTYYPPNQPTLKRCYDFGRAIGRAIDAWDVDKKVAVIASGGLSHFVVDEEFDRAGLAALKRKDEKALFSIPESLLQSGNSEFKNWIAVGGAVADKPLEMNLIDYQPCYRSEGGTGCAMGFALWQNP